MANAVTHSVRTRFAVAGVVRTQDTLRRDTVRPEGLCLDTLRLEDTRCVQMANAVTHPVRTRSAVAGVVWIRIAVAKCVQKAFSLTLGIRKTQAASRWQMP